MIGKPTTTSVFSNNRTCGLENHLTFFSSIYLCYGRGLNLLVGELQSHCHYNILFVCSDIMIPKVNTLSIDFSSILSRITLALKYCRICCLRVFLIIYIQLLYSALELAFRKHSCTVDFYIE